MPFELPRAKHTLFPHFAMIVTAIIWAISPAVVKITLRDVSVFTFLFYRFLIVGVIVLPYLFIELKKNPIDKRDLPDIIALGFAAQVSILLIFLALKYTTAIDTAVISIIGPILAFAAGIYFYQEKITRKEMFGIALATVGTLVVVLEPVLLGQNIFNGGGKRLLGNLFTLLYQLAWPTYIIIGKALLGENSTQTISAFRHIHLTKLHKKYSPGLISSLSFFVALVVFMPLSLIEATTSGFSLYLSHSAVLGILYMALLSSIVAYSLCQWAMKYLEVQETATYSYLSIVFTIPAAFLLLGEVPTKIMLIGAAVIAVGVVIAEKFKS